MKLKIAYFGSPEFSADFLEKILTDEELKKIVSVDFIVTQPDKPAGRKQLLTPTPVKKTARKYKIEIVEIEKSKIKNLSLKNNLKKRISQLDLAFIYAFSLIIPKEFLNLPKYGFWCFHPSLLPRYRGPSPIVFSLLCADKKTGGTIFKIDEKIDNGPIIAQKSLTILPTDYRPDLEKKLTDLGFEIFKKIILKLVNSQNSLTLKYQNNNSATYTRILKKEDGYIKYEILKKLLNNEKINFEELPKIIKDNNKNNKKINPHLLIFNFFRALSPWPGVWTILPDSKRLKIIEIKADFKKGKNINVLITKVQLEGKKPASLDIFKKNYKFL